MHTYCIKWIWWKSQSEWNCPQHSGEAYNKYHHTCIQFPPVDFTEEGMGPQLIARIIFESQSIIYRLGQQPFAYGLGFLTELFWVSHRIVENSVFHVFVVHLHTECRISQNITKRIEQPCTYIMYKDDYEGIFFWSIATCARVPGVFSNIIEQVSQSQNCSHLDVR